MGSYEELLRSTVDALLKADEPLSIDQLARLVSLRVWAGSRDDRNRPLDRVVLEAVLRGDPRFVEIAPGMWVRRTDGPEAGVPSRLRPAPLAGGAAAAVVPPEPHVDVDAVPPHEIRTPPPRFRGDPGVGRAATAAS